MLCSNYGTSDLECSVFCTLLSGLFKVRYLQMNWSVHKHFQFSIIDVDWTNAQTGLTELILN